MTTAETLAQIANAAEKELLENMTPEMRTWYLALPRADRVKIAQIAFQETAAKLAA